MAQDKNQTESLPEPGPGKAAGPETAKVRLSHRPHEEIEVPVSELPQLRNEGLLVDDKAAKPAASGATGRQ